MDANELRLEKIRIALRTREHVIELQSRRHVTVLAVALTLAGTGIFASTQPGAFVTAAALAGGMLVLAIFQIAGLRSLARRRGLAGAEAIAEVDRLMVREGEPDVDDA